MRPFAGFAPAPLAAQTYDLVLARGRVIDPESGLDASRWVGINGGKVAAISSAPVTGRRTVEVAGLVVAPGFIDLHAPGQDFVSSRLQARDGVTTALELEGGTGKVEPCVRAPSGPCGDQLRRHGEAREAVLADTVAAGPAFLYRNARPEEIERIAARIRQALDQGGLGIGYGIQYTPGATRGEIVWLFGVGAERGVTNFVHHRFASVKEPGSSVEATQELIAAAAVAGASVHMVRREHRLGSGARDHGDGRRCPGTRTWHAG